MSRKVLILAAFLTLARVAGLAREVLTASVFGPGTPTDGLYAALVLLTTAMTILSMALPTAVAQVVYARGRDAEERRRIVWGGLVAWLVVLALLALSAALFPRQIALVAQRGDDPELLAHAAPAIRLAGLVLLLQGLYIPLSVIAMAEGRHVLVAVLSPGFSVGGAAGVLLFHRLAGPNAVLLGTLAGSVAQVAVLLLALARASLGTPSFDWPRTRRAAREIGAILVPTLIGLLLLKLDTPLMAHLATGLRPGDLSIFSLALMVVNVPMSLANLALTQSLVPDLVRTAAAGPPAAFARIFGRACELALVLVLPLSALLVADPQGCVQALFVRGRFDLAAAERLAPAVRIWAAASWALVLGLLLEEGLHAHSRFRLVAALRGLSLLGIALGCYWGQQVGGLPGMLVGFAAVGVVRALALASVLARRAGFDPAAAFAGPVRLLACGALTLPLTHGAGALLSGAPAWARVAAEGGVATAALLLLAVWLRVETLSELASGLRLRAFGAPRTSGIDA